jgi:hypothetical protein
MPNIVKGKETTKSGLYDKGFYHSEGGIAVTVDRCKLIEVEKDEYKICNEAYESSKIYEFNQKTNIEVLDEIFRDASCTFKIDEADSGDFILCRPVVYNKRKYNRKGTVKDILNQMQKEKSCRVEIGNREFSKGGGVKSPAIQKNDAYKELEEKGFIFDWLTPVTSRFNINNWSQSNIKFDNFILYNKTTPKNSYGRVVETKSGHRYHLTTQSFDLGGVISNWFNGALSFLNW